MVLPFLLSLVFVFPLQDAPDECRLRPDGENKLNIGFVPTRHWSILRETDPITDEVKVTGFKLGKDDIHIALRCKSDRGISNATLWFDKAAKFAGGLVTIHWRFGTDKAETIEVKSFEDERVRHALVLPNPQEFLDRLMQYDKFAVRAVDMTGETWTGVFTLPCVETAMAEIRSRCSKTWKENEDEPRP